MQGMMVGQGDSAAVKWELIDSGAINHVYDGSNPDWKSPEVDSSKVNRCLMFKHYVHLTKAVIGNNYSKTPELYLDGAVSLGSGKSYESVDLGEVSADAFGTRIYASRFAVVTNGQVEGVSLTLVANDAPTVEFVGNYEIWGLMI